MSETVGDLWPGKNPNFRMKRQSRKNRCGRSANICKYHKYSFLRSLAQPKRVGPGGVARVAGRGSRRGSRVAARLAACAHPPAAPRRSSRRAKFGVGCRGGEARPSVACAVGGRTVDDQAECDGVDEDHHGHGGLALTLGAFGPGVMDELLFGASEKGAHCVTVVGYVDLRASRNGRAAETAKIHLVLPPPLSFMKKNNFASDLRTAISHEKTFVKQSTRILGF